RRSTAKKPGVWPPPGSSPCPARRPTGARPPPALQPTPAPEVSFHVQRLWTNQGSQAEGVEGTWTRRPRRVREHVADRTRGVQNHADRRGSELARRRPGSCCCGRMSRGEKAAEKCRPLPSTQATSDQSSPKRWTATVLTRAGRAADSRLPAA